MDKLKQVLKYRFWIFLVVALILPVVGWSMAKSGMVKEAEDRTKQIDGLKGKLNANADDPNVDWQKGVTDVNDVQKSQVRAAWLELYEQQMQLMVWPARMPDDPTKLETRHLEYYLTIYPKEIERVRQIVKPLDDYGETGLVDLVDALMPHPEDTWLSENRAPTAKETIAAQEDIWLLTGLLKSIADVNSIAGSQYDAPIRQIVDLRLRGGSDNFGGPAAGGVIAPGDDPSELSGGALRLGARRGGGLPSGQGFTGNVTFDPDDEFGREAPDPEAVAAAAQQSGGVVVPGDDPSELSGGAQHRYGGNMPMIRYVQDKPEWKTRGFYIELVMDHRKVPDLLVSLANSEWPIRIMRVHQADLKDEELFEAGPGNRGSVVAGDDDVAPLRAARAQMAPRRQAARPLPNADEDDGLSDRKSSSFGGRRGGAPPAARAPRVPGAASASTSALDDHMLATVAIDGVITIFKKPPEEEVAPAAGSQEAPGSQTAKPESETAAQPAVEAAEAPADEAGAAPESAESTEPAADEPSPKTEEATESDDKPPPEEPKPES